jgi:hypothetical protein
MDIMEPGIHKACSVCWGVCGFGSSRANLDMSRSKEGLTSLLHPKDLLAASAKCRMCSYLINRLKHRSSTISPDAKVVVNVRYFKFKNELDAWRSVDLLQIRIKCDGEDLPWLDTEWSILAHRGSYYPQTPVYSLLLQLTLPR